MFGVDVDIFLVLRRDTTRRDRPGVPRARGTLILRPRLFVVKVAGDSVVSRASLVIFDNEPGNDIALGAARPSSRS